MRCVWTILLSFPCLAMAYEGVSEFDAARAVLEIRCLECHTEDKAKGDLILTNRLPLREY